MARRRAQPALDALREPFRAQQIRCTRCLTLEDAGALGCHGEPRNAYDCRCPCASHARR